MPVQSSGQPFQKEGDGIMPQHKHAYRRMIKKRGLCLHAREVGQDGKSLAADRIQEGVERAHLKDQDDVS